MRDDFAVFILTHGRANNIKTLDTLKKQGYTGKYYIIIDDEDDQADIYKKKYGEKVIQFCKEETEKRTDVGDTSHERRCIIFARNESFIIAKNLGLKYFLELDDDYTTFSYRVERDGKFRQIKCKNLDKLFDYMLDFLEDTKAKTVALAQNGDFIGGKENDFWKKKVKRKAMNTFFCKTDNPVDFVGRINEDVNTYVTGGIRGELFLSIADACINQEQTQKAKGGMTEAYLDSGTYLKSFYSVMMAPSCVTVRMMGTSSRRMHHHIEWDYCCPKIISEKWKK